VVWLASSDSDSGMSVNSLVHLVHCPLDSLLATDPAGEGWYRGGRSTGWTSGIDNTNTARAARQMDAKRHSLQWNQWSHVDHRL